MSYDRLTVPGPRAQEPSEPDPPAAVGVGRLQDDQDALTVRLTELLDQLQAALVPRARIDQRWGVAWRYRPSDDAMRIGGDFLGVLERSDGSLALLIGDVAGRGAAAAGLGATLRSAWLATIHAGVEMSEIPAVLDRLLEHHISDPGTFATACLVEIDRAAGELRAISAGHDLPLLITAEAVTPLSVEPGPALGLKLRRERPLAQTALPSPGGVLLYTDGLTESRERPGAPRLGVEGLQERIDPDRILTQPSQQALDELLAASLPTGIQSFHDDLAALLVVPREP